MAAESQPADETTNKVSKVLLHLRVQEGFAPNQTRAIGMANEVARTATIRSLGTVTTQESLDADMRPDGVLIQMTGAENLLGTLSRMVLVAENGRINRSLPYEIANAYVSPATDDLSARQTLASLSAESDEGADDHGNVTYIADEVIEQKRLSQIAKFNAEIPDYIDAL